jgi:hypothetical protein
MKTAELALALAGIFLMLSLLAVFVVQKFYRTFPFFFICTAFAVFSTVSGLITVDHPVLYLWVYWGTEALYVLLAYLALQEAFKSVFKNFYHLPWFRLLFPSLGALMLCAATIRSIFVPAAEAKRAYATIIFLEIAIRFLELGLLFLFFGLVRFFHMRWRQHAFGIALGFGISAAGSLVVFLLRSEFGTKVDYVVRIAPPIAYTLAVVVWLVTFVAPQPNHPLQGQPPALTPEEMLAEVRQYSSTVKKILKR